ncbi:aminoglycoside phosphotransferase [Leptolyngbya sp. 'hensonii']|uniref:phosphotransferase enzyme family protein n=1 Tax=Leptolyngbya sp. 'hensonii' TaxID=1922337 RepID=UPI00094FF1F2|nr:aminoglycoside phosphotransferase family protein [Leptolyngbya sp. 'hensonii']OLP19858.1 aminoglycoside phosphotransferase [Leptolyngbya sp. 'hensonii']
MPSEPVISSPSRDQLVAIADQFAHQGNITRLQSFGSGNINDTFLVVLDDANQTHLVLQRINTRVFQQPHLIMQNMRTFTRHVADRLQQTPPDRRWEVPQVVLTQTGQDYWQDGDGQFWRAISFIAGTESFDTMHNPEQAREVGYALGMFHNLISDLPPDHLADTLEGFHITPRYLQQYEAVAAKTTVDQCPELSYCQQFVHDRKSLAVVLELAKEQGKLPLRLMHGDPKVNNVMFDIETGKAASVVDLDTVKPGLIHYDIGDCLRSSCNPAGEETEQWETVHFEPELCRSILQGYLSVAQEFLTENDYAYLFDAIRLITFELGLRFLTDHLAGNVYFKVKHTHHNLARALVQFRLTESIEAQETTIRHLIRDLR